MTKSVCICGAVAPLLGIASRILDASSDVPGFRQGISVLDPATEARHNQVLIVRASQRGVSRLPVLGKRVCVCVYIYIRVCVYIYMYIYVYACIYVSVYIYICTFFLIQRFWLQLCIYRYIYMYIHMGSLSWLLGQMYVPYGYTVICGIGQVLLLELRLAISDSEPRLRGREPWPKPIASRAWGLSVAAAYVYSK